jgi:hypothetical protein
MPRNLILGILSIVLLAIVRALNEDLPNFAFLSKSWRAVAVSALGLATLTIDKLTDGSDWATSFSAAFSIAGPSLVLLLVEALGGSQSGAAVAAVGGTETKAQISRMPPPPPKPNGYIYLPGLFMVASVTIVVGAILFYLSGCSSPQAKSACDAVRIADDACSAFVTVPLPDGTQEKVPRAKVVKLAEETKAARLAGPSK